MANGTDTTNNDFPAEWLDKNIIGDAFEILPQLPDRCLDFAVSDLPYNLRKYGDNPKDIDNLAFAEYVKKLEELANQLFRILKEGGYCCLMMGQDTRKLVALGEALTKAGFNENLQPIIVKEKEDYAHALLTACKGTPTIDLKEKLGIGDGIWVLKKWHYHPLKRVHPCTYSPEIPEALIRILTKEGDLILDPFNGIGTTTDVAEKLGRKFIGIDIYDWKIRAEEERKKAQRLIEEVLGLMATRSGDPKLDRQM